MNSYAIPTFIGALLPFISGIFVYKNKPQSRINITFALLCLIITVWLEAYGIMYMQNMEVVAFIFAKIGYTAVIFIPAIFFNFTLYFLKIEKKAFIVLGYILSAIFVTLLHLSPYFISGVYKYTWGYFPKASIAHPFFLAYLFSYIGGGLVLLFITLKKRKAALPPIEIKKIQYMFLALLIGPLSSIDFIPNYGIDFYPLGWVFIVTYIVVTAYAILKFQLLEIEVIIRRAVVFAGLFTSMFGVFVATTIFGQEFIAEQFGITNRWLMSTLAVTIIILIYQPLRDFLVNTTDRFLFQKKYDYQNVLKQASIGMAQITDLRKLISLIAHVISAKLHTMHVSIFLFNEDKNSYKLQISRGQDKIQGEIYLESDSPLLAWLSVKKEAVLLDEIKYKLEDRKILQHNPKLRGQLEKVKFQMEQLRAAVCIPAFIKEKFIGMLLLGEKRSRDIYSQTDLALLSTLTNQAAMAIENAQFYESVKETQSQLLQAEKMSTIGTMANGLSHQMNNRFNALGLIAADTLDTMKSIDLNKCSKEVKDFMGQAKHSFERIEANVHQGGDIVRGLLKYSRTGTEGLEPLSLNSIIDSALDMAQYKVKLDQFDLIRNYPKNLALIKGNPSQLQEVFFNLIDNAYDAIVERRDTLKEPGYRGKIEFSAQKLEHFLQITVQDTGMGVAPENQKKLFTPFFTTKISSHKGTGLGLYVIRRIITENHKGKVTISSEYKKGTRFVINLPLAKK